MSELLNFSHRRRRRPGDKCQPPDTKLRDVISAVSGLLCAGLLISMPSPAIAANADEPAAQEQNAASAAGDLTPAALLDDLESGAREKQARLVRLRLQLQRLAEESRRMREHATQPQTPPAPGIDDPPQPAAESDLEPLLPELAPNDLRAVPEPPDDGQVPAPGDAHGHATAPQATTTKSHTTETVVGASINRLALGDSLFGTGQTDLALQAYSNIELMKLAAADRYWIEYQIANCHRRLGNIPEAQQRYRKLAGLVDAGWCAGHARWWLDALSTRAELQKSLETVKSSLKAMEEQLNAESSR